MYVINEDRLGPVKPQEAATKSAMAVALVGALSVLAMPTYADVEDNVDVLVCNERFITFYAKPVGEDYALGRETVRRDKIDGFSEVLAANSSDGEHRVSVRIVGLYGGQGLSVLQIKGALYDDLVACLN